MAQALRAGVDETLTPEPEGAVADEVLSPSDRIMHDLEIAQGLVQPVAQYAIIETALRRAGGVQKQAAQILGLKPTTLNEKIKRLRIST